MNIPKLARYNGTVKIAHEFTEQNIVEFPIDPFELIKKFGWKLLTYQEMARKEGCTVRDISDCFGNDGYSIFNGKRYCIAYNSQIGSNGRIRFTLMHEIGHIILGHLKDFEVTSAFSNKLSKEEYKILENEANCFARNVLAPAPLIRDLSFWDKTLKICDFFNITYTANTNRMRFLKNDLYYLTSEQIENLQNKYKRHKICTNCSLNYLDENIKYCPHCGNKKLLLGDVFSMKRYKGINIKSLGECPKCENYDIKNDDYKYCKICGLKLKNTCSVCDKELDSSARFCTECGNKSTYFASNALMEWQIATDSSNVIIDPFTGKIEDDLPF